MGKGTPSPHLSRAPGLPGEETGVYILHLEKDLQKPSMQVQIDVHRFMQYHVLQINYHQV